MTITNYFLKPIGAAITLSCLATNVLANEKDKIVETVSIIGVQPEDVETFGGAAHQIDSETLNQDEYDDIGQILGKVPGVYIRDEDGYGLRPNIGMRGTTTERSQKITLMEDGILIAPAPYSAPSAYYFPLVSRMETIEVVKGPVGIKYGPNTVGGAVNLITRPIPFDEEMGIDISLGSDAYRKLHGHYGTSSHTAGWLVEGIQITTDGFKELDNGGDTGFDRKDFMAKGRINSPLSADIYHQLDAKLQFSEEVSDETYLGLSDDDFKQNPYRRYAASQHDRMEWEHLQFQLKYLVELNEDVSVLSQIYRNNFERKWAKLNHLGTDRSLLELLSDPDNGLNADYMSVIRGESDTQNPTERLFVGTNDREFFSHGIQSEINWLFDTENTKHDLTFGIRLHEDEIQRNHTEEAFEMQSGTMISTGAAPTATTVNTHNAKALAVFVQDKITYKNSTFTVGVRSETIRYEATDDLAASNQDNENDAVIFGAGVFHQLTDNLGLIAGAHQGFTPTGPGSDEEKPEESINYELGARYSDKTFRMESILFFNDYSNLSGLCTFSLNCDHSEKQRFNAGEVDIYGLELSTNTLFEINSVLALDVSASYTYTRSEFKTSFSSEFGLWGNVERGDPVPYIPEHAVGFSTTLVSNEWRTGLNIRYRGEMAEKAQQDGDDPLAGSWITPGTTVDFNSQYHFTDNHTLYAKVDNLFENDNIVSHRPYGARPQKPRSYYIGYKYTF